MPAQTNHIVKIFRAYHKDGGAFYHYPAEDHADSDIGTGTHDDFDLNPLPGLASQRMVWRKDQEISRIYLEFCPQGDMNRRSEERRVGKECLE